MNPAKLGESLTTVGGLLTVVAVIWWATFYRRFTDDIGDAFSCLYTDSWICAGARSLGQLDGASPYTPTLLYVGVGILIAGFVIKSSAD